MAPKLKIPKEKSNAITNHYCSELKPTIEDLRAEFHESYQTIVKILKANIHPERYKHEKALRYSRSKMGSKNPMTGKFTYQHPRWKGQCSDHKGYITKVMDGKRYFYHHIVMAQAMNIPLPSFPPSGFVVHHIDGNGENNDLSNLALVTDMAHKNLHSSKPKSWRKPMWELWVSGTLK